MKLSICFFSVLFTVVCAELQVGFYSSTCPTAESVIQSVVQRRFADDPSISAALLRMHFHDCFVRGCDASILIDGSEAEKFAGANGNVRGFDIINEAKALLEAQCPSTVSCADIITVAARDSVALAGGPSYDVPTGRRDGLVSKLTEVDLPTPQFSVGQASGSFDARGLTVSDMVTLLGAHTLGIAHCGLFQERFSDPNFVSTFEGRCSSSSDIVPMDHTPLKFDTDFYNQILSNRALLSIDQELGTDSSTSGVVSSLAADGSLFSSSFAEAMVKLGSVDVLVGDQGEIREDCRFINT
ncbi:peroxidase [Ranunculus cassubicifolius]